MNATPVTPRTQVPAGWRVLTNDAPQDEAALRRSLAEARTPDAVARVRGDAHLYGRAPVEVA